MKFRNIISLLIFLFNILSKKLISAEVLSGHENNKHKRSHGIKKNFEYLFDIPWHKEILSNSPNSKHNNKPIKLSEQKTFTKEQNKLNDVPIPKTNLWEDLKMGEGPSAYFFDFLDPLLQFEISFEFKRIFELAKNFPDDPLSDPYSFEKLFSPTNSYSQGNLPLRLSEKERAIWEKSLTVPQVNRLINDWEWLISTESDSAAKYFVDQYDFNGDGRLNYREFTLGMILENIENSGGKYSCKNCMEWIIDSQIDIMFKYLNNDNTSYITPQQLWDGLKHLKRGSNSNFFSLYNCQYRKNLRTVAVNDFVLKANVVTGKVTEKDFKLGILLGYWNRQTDDGEIHLENEKNKKKERWTVDGVDINCEKYKDNKENNFL